MAPDISMICQHGIGRHIYFSILLSALAVFALGGCARTADTDFPIEMVAAEPVIAIPKGSNTAPIQFQKIIINLKRYESLGDLLYGTKCVRRGSITPRETRNYVGGPRFNEAVASEMKAANYNVVEIPDSLFPTDPSIQPEYLLAGQVKKVKVNMCYPFGGRSAIGTTTGRGHMEIEWELYNRLDRKVIYKRSTEGSAILTNPPDDGITETLLASLSAATRNLLADREFHDLVAATSEIAQPLQHDQIIEVHNPRLQSKPVAYHADAIESAVATIITVSGHGSGFFVGNRGHLLTNWHVVGNSRRVRVRLSNGEELPGEVLAAHRGRDVALLYVGKARAVGLPLSFERLSVGSRVFAVGSPLDTSLSSTFSAGIVSAYRTHRSFKYIQSDVNILPGSSGGPLLDEFGNVVGMTQKAHSFGLTNINYFIPISDVLTTLGINAGQPGAPTVSQSQEAARQPTAAAQTAAVPVVEAQPDEVAAQSDRSTRQSDKNQEQPRGESEQQLWERISESVDPEDYKAYLESYPNGQFAILARSRAELRSGKLWSPVDARAISPEAQRRVLSYFESQRRRIVVQLSHYNEKSRIGPASDGHRYKVKSVLNVDVLDADKSGTVVKVTFALDDFYQTSYSFIYGAHWRNGHLILAAHQRT